MLKRLVMNVIDIYPQEVDFFEPHELDEMLKYLDGEPEYFEDFDIA